MSGEPDLSRMPLVAPYRIRPPTQRVGVSWRELWEYRELLYFLVWRDLKVRYRQTVLGVAWAVIQPILTMLVLSVIFGEIAGLSSDGVPYTLFTLCALLPWQLFSRALTTSAGSLVSSQALLTKVYFPRLFIPLASILSGLPDFTAGFVVLLGMLLVYGITPGLAILALPLFLVLNLMTGLGVGLWLAALNVQYRDVQQGVPFLAQLWFYITPIAYAASLVPSWVRPWHGLNPMVGVVEGFRWALLGRSQALDPALALGLVTAGLLLIGGLVYFQRMEDTFADVV